MKITGPLLLSEKVTSLFDKPEAFSFKRLHFKQTFHKDTIFDVIEYQSYKNILVVKKFSIDKAKMRKMDALNLVVSHADNLFLFYFTVIRNEPNNSH